MHTCSGLTRRPVVNLYRLNNVNFPAKLASIRCIFNITWETFTNVTAVKFFKHGLDHLSKYVQHSHHTRPSPSHHYSSPPTLLLILLLQLLLLLLSPLLLLVTPLQSRWTRRRPGRCSCPAPWVSPGCPPETRQLSSSYGT